MRPDRNTGITLVELVLTIAVLAILAGAGVPPMLALLERMRLGSAAEALRGDLLLARSEAIRRNTPVTVSIRSDAAHTRWCYALNTGDGCDCFRPGDCRLRHAPGRGGSSTEFKRLRLGSNFRGGVLRFFPARGTATAGTAWLAAGGHRVQIKVSALGRVRACANGLRGYPPC